MTPILLLVFRPGALVRVFPMEFGVTAGDQLLLDVGAIDGQFRDGAAVAICGDAADANGVADNQ